MTNFRVAECFSAAARLVRGAESAGRTLLMSRADCECAVPRLIEILGKAEGYMRAIQDPADAAKYAALGDPAASARSRLSHISVRRPARRVRLPSAPISTSASRDRLRCRMRLSRQSMTSSRKPRLFYDRCRRFQASAGELPQSRATAHRAVTKSQSLRADFARAVTRLDEALALPKDPIVRDSAI